MSEIVLIPDARFLISVKSRARAPNDTDASAFIVGDPRGRIWQQRGETFEAFEKRVKAAAEAARDYRNNLAEGRPGGADRCRP